MFVIAKLQKCPPPQPSTPYLTIHFSTLLHLHLHLLPPYDFVSDRTTDQQPPLRINPHTHVFPSSFRLLAYKLLVVFTSVSKT
ncbi:hypothetical protein L1987_65714 [Smallanthus sonchifolius]|uniref:Uncharacterized protein n=1 Tax=Smallanthus sonchifolius TaxID=185202 RepID=A0ACB9BVF6_9ASTR|nr:hypothetical protein L1987_65714 [Smallanthus sonchifolius]